MRRLHSRTSTPSTKGKDFDSAHVLGPVLVIAHASRAETMRPAEVFGSGTVDGGSAAEVGKTLHAGDVVELTVDRLGTLRNTVVRHRPADAGVTPSAR